MSARKMKTGSRARAADRCDRCGKKACKNCRRYLFLLCSECNRTALTIVSPEVIKRMEAVFHLVASRPSWDAQDLIHRLREVYQ